MLVVPWVLCLTELVLAHTPTSIADSTSTCSPQLGRAMSQDLLEPALNSTQGNMAQTFAELLAKLKLMSVLDRRTGLPTSLNQHLGVHRGQWSIRTLEGDLLVDSWKFPEFDYTPKTTTLPCRARGLFTADRIIARGYDKFFNVGEYEELSIEALRKDCSGPFTAATKENGCIMFFAGLEDGTLVVCLKNVTGDADAELKGSKHYKRGIFEIGRQLERIGKTTRDVAKVLYEQNITAVAELCDDEFEEHVLAYPPAVAGLYLHGLNANSIQFSTSDMPTVVSFAAEWGFQPVLFETFDDFDSLLLFMQTHAKSGMYHGREIEGFVVRCTRDGHDYFFKYKFEQPYLLYRQLRLATLKLLTSKRELREIVSSFPRYQKLTLAYLDFIIEYFKENPGAAEDYERNIGIIKTRNLFLKHLGFEDHPIDVLNMEETDKLSSRLESLVKNTHTVYCVLTIATPGCGKTTTCKTLEGMAPERWGHVQNDDYAKSSAFFAEVLKQLASKQLVFLDRVNYRAKYRQDVFEKIAEMRKDYLMPNVEIKYIGINFLKSGQNEEVRELLTSRILSRGDNHQSIKAKTNSAAALAPLRDMYAHFEAPKFSAEADRGSGLPTSIEGHCLARADLNFSLVINVDPFSSLENAITIYTELTKAYPELEVPDMIPEKWNKSYLAALAYEPVFQKTVAPPQRKVSYYGINIDQASIMAELEKHLHDNAQWQKLVAAGRVQDEFHLTLSHSSCLRSSSENKEKWELLGRLFSKNAHRKTARPFEKTMVNYFCDVTIDKIVIVHDTLIVLTARLSECYEKKDWRIHYRDVLPSTNPQLHITIGTMDESIKPMMSNVYLAQMLKGSQIAAGNYRLPSAVISVIPARLAILEKQQAFIYFA